MKKGKEEVVVKNKPVSLWFILYLLLVLISFCCILMLVIEHNHKVTFCEMNNAQTRLINSMGNLVNYYNNDFDFNEFDEICCPKPVCWFNWCPEYFNPKLDGVKRE